MTACAADNGLDARARPGDLMLKFKCPGAPACRLYALTGRIRLPVTLPRRQYVLSIVRQLTIIASIYLRRHR